MGNPRKRGRQNEDTGLSTNRQQKVLKENRIIINNFLQEISVPALSWKKVGKGYSFDTQSLTYIEARKYCMMLNARTGTSRFWIAKDVYDAKRYCITAKLDMDMINQYYKKLGRNNAMRMNMKVLNLVNSRFEPFSMYEVGIDESERLSVYVKPFFVPFFGNKNAMAGEAVRRVPAIESDVIILGKDVLETLHLALWHSIPYKNNGYPLLVENGLNWTYQNDNTQMHESVCLCTYTFTQALVKPLYALANYKYQSLQFALAEGACEGIISIAADIETTDGRKLSIPSSVSRLIGNFLFFQRADVSTLPLVCQAASAQANKLVNNEGTDLPEEAVNQYKNVIWATLGFTRS